MIAVKYGGNNSKTFLNFDLGSLQISATHILKMTMSPHHFAVDYPLDYEYI